MVATPYEMAPGLISLEAAADHTSNQYKFMKIDSNGRAALASVDGEFCIGVLEDKPSAVGTVGLVRTGGVAKIKASAAIAAGAKISTTNAGLAVTSASTKQVLGIAVTAAGAANDVISILLAPSGPLP